MTERHGLLDNKVADAAVLVVVNVLRPKRRALEGTVSIGLTCCAHGKPLSATRGKTTPSVGGLGGQAPLLRCTCATASFRGILAARGAGVEAQGWGGGGTERTEPQMPVAAISMRTSSGPTGSSSVSA